MEARKEMGKIMAYCIQDSELVIRLMEKLSVWESAVEMSGVVCQNIEDLFLKGQSTRCTSMIYNELHQRGYVLTRRNDAPVVKGYKGGYVAPTVPGKHKKVICEDFASLYPSIDEGYNICYTTLVKDKSLVNKEDCNVVHVTQQESKSNHVYYRKAREEGYDEYDESSSEDEDDKKKKKKAKKEEEFETKEYEFWFYKKEKGVIPSLLNGVLAKRKGVNKLKGDTETYIRKLKHKEDILAILSKIELGESIGTVEAAEEEIDRLQNLPEAPPAKVINKAKSILYMANLVDEAYEPKDKDEEGIVILYKTKDSIAIKKKIEEIKEGIPNGDISKYIKELSDTCVNLHAKQNALKVAANSVYGFLGMAGEAMPYSFIEGAMSITSKGRELITTVADVIKEKFGGQMIAGDTDSVMIQLPEELVPTTKECSYWGIK